MESTLDQVTVIEAGKTERQYWKDLWRYRELFLFLAWREVLVRYKQTAIGIAWSVIKPLLTMIIFTVLFSKVAHLPCPIRSYQVLVFAGMVPWQFFSNALAESSASLVTNTNMVAKIYFPRIVVPVSAVLASLADYAITLVLMFLLMAYFHTTPSINIVWLPVFTLLAVVAVLGPSLWMSALNVKYRDFRYIIPFIVQFGLYVSPVGYATAVIPPRWGYWYSLNPMVGVIDGFRWCVLGDKFPINPASFAISTAVSAAFLAWGITYFRRTERTFADHI